MRACRGGLRKLSIGRFVRLRKRGGKENRRSREINAVGAWTLSFAKQPDGEEPTLEKFAALEDVATIDAVVPGNAEIDMLRAGLIEDPTVGDNVFKLLKYEAYQWKYSREFPTPELKAGQRAVLNFGGIDTLADIYLNGELVGKAENMFIAHEFDITKLLKKSGANKLDVLIRSTPMEAAKFTPPWGIRNPVEFQNIRKAPASFGWDIHPRLMTVGIWKSVSLDIRNPINIKDVNIWTWKINLEKKTADLHVDVRIDAPYAQFADLKMRVQLSRKGKPHNNENVAHFQLLHGDEIHRYCKRRFPVAARLRRARTLRRESGSARLCRQRSCARLRQGGHTHHTPRVQGAEAARRRHHSSRLGQRKRQKPQGES